MAPSLAGPRALLAGVIAEHVLDVDVRVEIVLIGVVVGPSPAPLVACKNKIFQFFVSTVVLCVLKP